MQCRDSRKPIPTFWFKNDYITFMVVPFGITSFPCGQRSERWPPSFLRRRCERLPFPFWIYFRVVSIREMWVNQT